VVFLYFGIVTVWIFADMPKDPVLSYMTNTKPGELGVDYWKQIIGFGVGPLLGLLTTLFPSITDFVVSWLQSNLQGLK
jgi:hypothetical protein